MKLPQKPSATRSWKHSPGAKLTRPINDAGWLAATASLAARGRPLSRPNPAVGAIIVKDSVVLGRGWTQAGGRPHAEALALAEAGDAAKGATLYVTLEPCAHESARGPACADLICQSGLSRVLVGVADPDPRTSGMGMERIRSAGISCELADDANCRASLEGYLALRQWGRPNVTLKLALSIDGCIALGDGTSQWITGSIARAHTHAMRAKSDAILCGMGTLKADAPRLDVRLAGLEDRSPRRFVLTNQSSAPDGWEILPSPDAVHGLGDVQYLFVEGGAGAAASFLRADLVDRLIVYRAPIIIGSGMPSIGDIGLTDLASAHGRWTLADRRQLGSDSLEVYERFR